MSALHAAVLNCTFWSGGFRRGSAERSSYGFSLFSLGTRANRTKVKTQQGGRTLQQVGQGLGPQRHGPLGFVVGDGELLHAQLLGHFGLSAVVDQRATQQLWTQTDRQDQV